MKIKRNDILVFWQSLQTLGNLEGARFAYAITKNINIIKPEVQAINEVKNNDKEFIEYEEKHIELAKSFAEKDEKGEPIIKNNNYSIVDTQGFTKELEKLNKEYTLETLTKFLEEEVELNLHMIKPDDLPEKITVSQLESISRIIE